ncbi:efflux RND transporter periplasmic adaptor subunit [Sedimentitalea sp.]|uniref:efflux RND transporter periplasmic adaptor subunit n=1 Tax=Sedimentitalea sp. TaxID=2048915 RepID=UPI003297ABD6
MKKTWENPVRANRIKSSIISLLGLLAIAGFAPASGIAQEAPSPAAVTVVMMQAQDVTLTRDLPGRVVALGVAEVRPQVSGIITDQLFEEGATVSEGDPMYRIDDAIYAAQVQMSRASVEEARVALANAERDEERNATLFLRKVVSQTAVDDAKAIRDEARAALVVAQAQLRASEIDLEHTTVRAPLSGVVGRALTTRGALATAAQASPLAIIRQIDAVFVDVAASAADVVRRRRAAADPESTSDASSSDTTVMLTLADGSQYDQTGTILAAEPQVNVMTGVSVLRLKFPNPDGILLPGMYVNATLPAGTATGAILAPQEGVSRDRRGEPTALVVNDGNTVELRNLTVMGTRGTDWIVTEGLEAGDRVIVAGLQKVTTGAVVTPQERAAEPASE